MTPQTFIFIGRSGCGKGTQAELLMKFLTEKSPDIAQYYLETGKRFRDFIAQDGTTQSLAKQVMQNGDRQPDFLAVWMWSHLLIEEFKGTEHLIMDGTPRSKEEALILDNGLKFYKREKPQVIYINVSRAWSERHLLSRGRADDSVEGIKKRLDWFDRDVMPAVEYFRNHPDYHFVEVQGEQSIEKVNEELMQKISL